MKALNLFGVVPVAHEDAERAGEPVILAEYGVVVAPSALLFLDTIRAWLAQETLTAERLNDTSFYRSWYTAATVEDRQRLADQALHYYSTYGLRSIGIDDPALFYLPVDPHQEAPPQPMALRVIRGVPRREVIRACLDLLRRPVALKQETVLDIIECLVAECGYTFNGDEEIGSNEARVIVAERTGVLPRRGDDLLRFLVFRATGKSLVIKDQATLTAIAESGVALPALDADRLAALAESFRRHKAIWLAFKHAHPANRPVVNRLAKLAQRLHRPLRPDVLDMLTAHELAIPDVAAAAARAPLSRVVRALNAVRLYRAEERARLYRVRNGKGFACPDPRERTGIPLARYEEVLLREVQRRCADRAVRTPEGVRYAFPVSEKAFCGDVPAYTSLVLPPRSSALLVGVYWEDAPSQRVDLDLSMLDTETGLKIGWNADWRSAAILYSGDVTAAPTGASEWMLVRSVDRPYLLLLNAYAAPDQHPFTLIVGDGKRCESGQELRNYLISPDEVIWSVKMVCTQKQMILGLLAPDPQGIRFVLIGQGMGGRIVSRQGPHERTAMAALAARATTVLMLDEVLPQRAEGIDLSTPAQERFLALLDATPPQPPQP